MAAERTEYGAPVLPEHMELASKVLATCEWVPSDEERREAAWIIADYAYRQQQTETSYRASAGV